MATKKSAGVSKNGRDSNPQYLGVKVNHGEAISIGEIIVRQRGTVYIPGKNVAKGSDDTLFSMKDGVVKFGSKRKTNFDGSVSRHKIVSVE